MEKKTFYKWVLLQKDKDTNETIVVNYGIVEEPIEIFVDEVFPHCSSSVDKDLWDMQKYADENFPDEHYTFEYEEIKIDFSDLVD